MSTAIVVPDSFKAPVAAAFAGVQAADDLSGGITGGYGLLKYRGKVWSIQYQGNVVNLMRDDGDGPRGSVEVVILKANPSLSKTWYEGGWDENSNNPPDCASANGIFPDAGVPKKQSNTCATCPRNAWGSAPNGGKGKACGDHRRMAIVPLADLKNESFGGALLLRCPAASLQDLAAFNARYHQMGYPYFSMGIKISFDPQESFPKFQFAAIRPLTEQEAQVVLAMRDTAEVNRVVSETLTPAVPQQVTAQPQPAFLEAPPANAVQPTGPAPVQPAPAPAAPVQPALSGGNGAAAPVATGFGPAGTAPAAAAAAAAPSPAPAAVRAAPAAQPAPAAVHVQPQQAAPAPVAAPQPAPVAVQPARQMTGFGAAAPETPAPAAAPAGPAAAPAGPAVSPGVVTAFEGSIDDRLNALINA